MTKKYLYFSVVIAILSLVIIGQVSGATAPQTTPLGYNTLPGFAPARVAADSSGRIYVTDANSDSVKVFSNNGTFLFSISVMKPLGIGVDSTGKIFVGSTADGSVSVFSGNGAFLYKLGAGAGEFGLPNDIAISTSGTVYVTDSTQNQVKAYTLAGAPLFSISGLNFPTGIAVDDAAGELFVSDHKSGLVKIFDMNGALKRYIRGSSAWSSVFIRPQGIALDSTRIYIADAYNSNITVYGKDGIFLTRMGNYGGNLGEFKTPLDVVIDKDSKLFVANHNNARVEIIGVDNYGLLNVTPNTLSLSVFENGEPVTQTVNLTSTGNQAGWIASSSSWISVSPGGGTTPSDVNITINPAGLSAGNYTDQVMFSAPSGVAAIVLVSLEVKPQPKTLYVSPASISFKYQQESPNLPSASIAITSGGGSLSWTAGGGADWTGLSSTAGETPSNIRLGITNGVNTLKPGTYSTSITIDGGNAQGSPASVNVSLTVINAGTVKVKTNLADAGFDITGPVSYSGTGTEWSNDEVAPGDYTITFRHVTGYIKPATKTFTVTSGQETVLNGTYRTKSVATNIIAGSGGSNGKSVDVLALDGTLVTSFEPFKPAGEIKVATGDIDGSGLDKIIVTDNKNAIKVYTIEGKELAAIELPSWYKNTELAVADIDNDGIAEIIAGSENDQGREIKILKYADNKLTEAGVLYTEANNKGFKIAAGDINGDGKPEIIIADENNVRAFAIDTGSKLTQLWAVNRQYENNVEIAAGDINDDGIAEIAVTQSIVGAKAGKGKYKEIGLVKILKGTGEDYGITINAYGDLGYEMPSRVAFGDIDGDGSDEIITGAGDDAHNEALIRTFETNGAFTGLTIKASDGKFGVNVSLGRFK